MTQPTVPAVTSIHAVGEDGVRRAVAGESVIVAFGDGRELHITFSRHPMSDGGVILRSEFLAPGAEPAARILGRLPDVFAVMNLRPGGGNVMRVGVGARSREGEAVRIQESTPAPHAELQVVEGESRRPIHERVLVMGLRNGADLTVRIGGAPGQGEGKPGADAPAGGVTLQAGADPTREEVERFRSSGVIASSTFWVSFGAANVVHVLVRREDATRAIMSAGDVVDAWTYQWRVQGEARARRRMLEAAGSIGPAVIGELVARLLVPDVRQVEHDILGMLTGQDFGFDPAAPPLEREAEARRWREWWEGAKDHLVFDPVQHRFVVK